MVSQGNGEKWQVRAARNQSMFRAVNERLTDGDDDGKGALRIACECADRDCVETVVISASDYERLREHPNRFAVVDGHVYPDVEDVVETSREFVTVAKRDEGGEIASATHERSNA